MKTYAGIDLHSSNNYIVVIDENDKRLFEKRLPRNGEVISSSFLSNKIARASYYVMRDQVDYDVEYLFRK